MTDQSAEGTIRRALRDLKAGREEAAKDVLRRYLCQKSAESKMTDRTNWSHIRLRAADTYHDVAQLHLHEFVPESRGITG